MLITSVVLGFWETVRCLWERRCLKLSVIGVMSLSEKRVSVVGVVSLTLCDLSASFRCWVDASLFGFRQLTHEALFRAD